MSFDLDQLYNLLPAIYRIQDIERGDKPLKALLSVIADSIQVLEEDLSQLYDDQFIETCQEWVVPYIGDLVSYSTPHDVLARSPRVEVANTISYRRRKGTATMLEQLARDVTAWSVHVVEFFKLLAQSQHVNRVRLDTTSPDLRKRTALEHLNTPFDTLVHTADVRSIAMGRGRYNIPNIGIFVWRLNSYSLTNSPAVKVDNYRYLFNPLGTTLQLFSHPQVEQDVTQLSGQKNVAMPITRSMLTSYLDDYYGVDKSILLTINGRQYTSDLIEAADLSDAKDSNGNPMKDDADNTVWANAPREKIAIDPVLGRIAFPRGRGKRMPKNVQVTCYYGFSAEMGGGEYSRVDSFTRIDPFTTQVLAIERVPVPDGTIAKALTNLNGSGVVEITGSGRFSESPSMYAPANAFVELRAAERCRPLLVLTNDAAKTDNPVTPELSISGEEGATVVLNGLVISSGRLHVSGNLSRLVLRHCTLVPGLAASDDGSKRNESQPKVVESESESEEVKRNRRGETVVTEREDIHVEIDRYSPQVSVIVEAPAVAVELDHCIVGGLRVVESAQVQITNSIVDATSQHAIAYCGLDETTAGAPLHVENSTLIGQVHTSLMELASNTIFLARRTGGERAPVQVARRQSGCVRYSYLPARSRVPRLYYCQPVDEQAAEWVHPQFTSLRYGDPGYCQLSRRTANEIRRGADDESEMGAFHDLYQPQRETNLALRLKEYLRFTLEAGVYYLN